MPPRLAPPLRPEGATRVGRRRIVSVAGRRWLPRRVASSGPGGNIGMGTSRRLLGLVLLLVVVGVGGYLLYAERQRQTAEREAAATAPAPAPAATAADGPATAPVATAPDPGSEGVPPATAPSTGTAAGDAAASAAASTEAPATETTPTGTASGASAPGSPDTPATTGAAPDAAAAVSSTAPTATPAAPGETISQPEPVVPPVAGEAELPGVPSFDVVRVEPGGDAVMAGRSEPGMVIALFANGQEIGRTRANDSGEWVITLEEPLRPGEYVITIVGATPDGARQVESVDRIAVSVPQGKSEPPMVALMSPDAPTKVLQQPDAPAAGTAVATASAEPVPGAAAPSTPDGAAGGTSADTPAGAEASATGAAAPPPVWAQPFATDGAPATAGPATPAAAALAVGVVEKDGDTVTVSGASLPGATVRVYVNDAPIGAAVADATGRWTFSGPHPVEAGAHTVRADQIDPATGAVVARSAVPFEVLSAAEIAAAPATPETPAMTLPPATPAETATVGGAAPEPAATTGSADAAAAAGTGPRKIRIRRGDDLWTLAERYYGKRRGVRYTAIYRANRKQIRDPDLIYPGQVIIIPQ